MSIGDYVADMFKRLIAVGVFLLLGALVLAGAIALILLIGWLMGGAHV